MDAVASVEMMPNDDQAIDARLDLPYRRIIIYGVTGSGKSTLASRLGALTGIPWIEVDSLTWEPGWIEVPNDIQRNRIAEVCLGEEWILDHAYGTWLDVVLARADLIIALDYSRGRSLWQLIRRTFRRIAKKERVCNGNLEDWRKVFSRDSIIAWHFKSFSRKRERIRKWETDPEITVKVLRKPRDFDEWVLEMRIEKILLDDPLPSGANELDMVEYLMKHEDEF